MCKIPMILQCTFYGLRCYGTEIKYPQNHVYLYIIDRYLCVFRQQLLSWNYTNYIRL